MHTLRLFASGQLQVPAATAWYLSDLGEFRGKQELYTRQSPQRLKVLREHALIESAVSSNRIEGVAVDASRIREVLVAPKPLSLTIDEFALEKQWWGGAARQRCKASQHAWRVSTKDIAARSYNLDCKNPHEVAGNHGGPGELMQEYQEIVRQRTLAQSALKAELMQALGGKA